MMQFLIGAFIVLIILVLAVLASCIKIVPQAHAFIVERLGGYLATCSCSHFASDEMFQKMLRHAAADASVSLRQIETRQQGPDHPILWGMPETNYLKFYLFQVC